jgi:glycosyltransferase involved in cell wall biosynthesis
MVPLVSIIIPTYNRQADLDRCLASLLKSDYPRLEIIVVNNASTDDTTKLLLKKYSSKIIIITSQTNLMAAGGRNLGATKANGKYLFFLDDDNTVTKTAISQLVSSFTTLPQLGLAGPLMYFGHDKKDFGGLAPPSIFGLAIATSLHYQR